MCDKKFKFPYKLAQHMITHTKSRKHACDDCGNAIRQSSVSFENIQHRYVLLRLQERSSRLTHL